MYTLRLKRHTLNPLRLAAGNLEVLYSSERLAWSLRIDFTMILSADL